MKQKLRQTFVVLFLVSCAGYSQSAKQPKINPITKINAKLDSVYQQINIIYKNDTLFLQKLKKSQEIWKELRAANVAMKYPEEKKQLKYGSVYPQCLETFLIDLTQKRIDYLNTWLTGVKEGEVCAGSVHFNN